MWERTLSPARRTKTPQRIANPGCPTLPDNVSARIQTSKVRLLEGALECARAGYIPAGLKANREFAECMVTYEDKISDDLKALLFDPQTAGGLLISVQKESVADLIQALAARGVSVAEIGSVQPRTKVLIEVAP
ncbi:MAG: hypothetical protein DMG95_02215 [Acidobacteria bacterium]|nr:MAG: hypothetical protein DMG95_02215 [Acidobacteriota bacterium]